MSERDRRMEERKERRARRIQEQRVAEGRERREFRFFRRRRGPPPKKAEKPKTSIESVKDYGFTTYFIDAKGEVEKEYAEKTLATYDPHPSGYDLLPPKDKADPIDRLVTGFTGRLWRRAEEIRSSTEPLSYEEQRYRMRKRELPDLPLAMKRAELGALNIGIGAVESFTFPVRPSAWVRTAEGLVGLATDKERRREAVEFAQARPEAVGLQLMGAVFGGYAAGRVIGRLRGPKTYTLKQKTATIKEVKTGIGKGYSLKGIDKKTDWSASDVRSYIPRGKWTPAYTGKGAWQDILRKGGTAVVQLKDRPGYVTYYEPTAVYGLSRLGLIGLSGIHGRTTTEVKSDTVEKQIESQLQRVGLDQRQRGREREMFTTDELLEETQEQRRVILPDLKPFIRPRPTPMPPGFVESPVIIQEQRQRQRVITLPDLRLEQTQVQQQRQVQSLAQIQRFSYREPNLEPVHLRRRKKKGRKGELDLFTFGEMRTYPIKRVEKLMKEMGL